MHDIGRHCGAGPKGAPVAHEGSLVITDPLTDAECSCRQLVSDAHKEPLLIWLRHT
jgi:hypothetical protein